MLLEHLRRSRPPVEGEASRETGCGCGESDDALALEEPDEAHLVVMGHRVDRVEADEVSSRPAQRLGLPASTRLSRSPAFLPRFRPLLSTIRDAENQPDLGRTCLDTDAAIERLTLNDLRGATEQKKTTITALAAIYVNQALAERRELLRSDSIRKAAGSETTETPRNRDHAFASRLAADKPCRKRRKLSIAHAERRARRYLGSAVPFTSRRRSVNGKPKGRSRSNQLPSGSKAPTVPEVPTHSRPPFT